jgi:hypothetical protein
MIRKTRYTAFALAATLAVSAHVPGVASAQPADGGARELPPLEVKVRITVAGGACLDSEAANKDSEKPVIHQTCKHGDAAAAQKFEIRKSYRGYTIKTSNGKCLIEARDMTGGNDDIISANGCSQPNDSQQFNFEKVGGSRNYNIKTHDKCVHADRRPGGPVIEHKCEQMSGMVMEFGIEKDWY